QFRERFVIGTANRFKFSSNFACFLLSGVAANDEIRRAYFEPTIPGIAVCVDPRHEEKSEGNHSSPAQKWHDVQHVISSSLLSRALLPLCSDISAAKLALFRRLSVCYRSFPSSQGRSRARIVHAGLGRDLRGGAKRTATFLRVSVSGRTLFVGCTADGCA